MKLTKKRPLQFESLENRMLLSATPVTLQDVQPAGTDAVCWTKTFNLQNQEKLEFEFQTAGLESLMVYCINANNINTYISFGNQSDTNSSSRGKEVTPTTDTMIYTIQNKASVQGNYTLFAFSGCNLEKEIQVSSKNNDSLGSAESLAFSYISETARQTVLVGQLSEKSGISDEDCYSFTSVGGNVSIQLHTDTASALTFEIYDSATAEEPIAYATNIDDFTTLLNSVRVSKGQKLYIHVHASEGTEASTVNYTLTVTENASANTSTNEETQLINALSTGDLFFGKLQGTEGEWTENAQTVENGQIRAIDSDGNRMAIVSYDSTHSEATLHLWKYIGSAWSEIASATYSISNREVAVSICGNSVLVGNKGTNTAYIFTLEGEKLVQTDLTISSLTEEACFGTDVQLTEKYAFISANGSNSGIVYIFAKEEDGWNLLQTLTGFGTLLTWDSEQERLCVTSNTSNNKLSFFTLDSEGKFTLETFLTGSSVSDFGSAVALEGNWLAVSCKKNSLGQVQLYNWNETTQTWVLKQTIKSPDEIPSSFGDSLSFANNQLAISSKCSNGSKLTGNVHLYRCVSTGSSVKWNFVQTYDASTSSSFGKTVLLAPERLDVFDYNGNSISSLTNFSTGDSWDLNITSTQAKVSFSFLKSESEKNVLILAPDGSVQTFTKTISEDLISISFTPPQTGVYKIQLFSDSTASYFLRVNSGSSAALSSGTVADPVKYSNKVTVEYAQQVLVSSLDGATATFKNAYNEEKELEVAEIVNGNQVVWEVPETVANGTYVLTISGLQAVSGNPLDVVSTATYYYTGSHTLNLSPVGTEENSVKRGSLEIEVDSLFEIPNVTKAESENIRFLVTDLKNYQINRNYDEESQCLKVRITSSEATGNIHVEAALNASFDPSEVLSPGKSAVGTLEGNKTQSFTLSLASGQSANLALTTTDTTSLESVKMELFDSKGTLLAVDTQLDGDSTSQWIQTLRNTTESDASYTIKLTNQTNEATDFTLEVIVAEASTEPTATFAENQQYFAEYQTSVTLEFSENVDISSLTASDFQLLLGEDAQTATKVQEIKMQDGTHALLTFNTSLKDGIWTVDLADGAAIQTLSGTNFTLTPATFCVDTVTPAVRSISFATDSSTGKTLIHVQFSEAVQSADPTFTGKIYGSVSLTSSGYDSETNTWTLTTSVALPSDFYTFSISNIKDLAGNVTETATTKGLAVTSSKATTVPNEVSTATEGWLAQYLDGSQAFVHSITGCVTVSQTASFVLEGIEDGEQIAFSFMSPAGYSEKCWNDHIKAEWNAETKTVTIRYDSTAHSGGLTEEESAKETADLVSDGKKCGVFVMYILRNANYENADLKDPIDVQLSELGTKTDEQGNVQKIRQTSMMGTISEATDSDVYRFTVEGKSTIYAGLTANGSTATFKIQLYEELPDGSRSTLLAEADSSSMGEEVSDSLDVWIQNIRNHSDEARTFQLVVSASGTGAAGSLYTMVLTENATFNAETYVTAQTITELYGTNSAVGHVSSGISGFTTAGIYNLLDSASSAVCGNYVFVGDSENNQVIIYTPNSAGTALENVGIIQTDESVSGDGFGTTLVLNGNTLAISAPAHANEDGTTGVVYLFSLESIKSTGSSTPFMTITNPSTSEDFGLVMDYSDALKLLVVGSQTAYGSSYAFLLNEDATEVGQTVNLTQMWGGMVNLELEEDGQTPVIQGGSLVWSDVWSYIGYSVAIDDAGFFVVGAPQANTYSTYDSTTKTWSTETDLNGMVFVYSFVDEGFSGRLTENSDSYFGYSVTCEDGILVIASAPAKESGIALHTFDLLESSPTENRVVNSTLVISENVGMLPQAVQLRDGFLYVTGAYVSATDTQLTLCSQSTWPYDSQVDAYQFTASDSTISLTFDAGLGSSASNLALSLTDANGNPIQGTVSEGIVTFSVTQGTEYFLYISAVESFECDYVMTVDGITQKDYAFQMTDLKVNGKDVSETLTTCPTSVTLTLEEAVRADLISNASVQIDGVSATGFTLSEDGKTVTFTFAYKQFTQTTATLTIQANDFCTLDGSVLTLATGEATQTLTLAQSTATQKIRARENSLEAVWTFAENLTDWSSARVVIQKKAKGSTNWVNITSTGSLSCSGNVLTWTAGSIFAETDDQISIYLDVTSVSTVSGCPIAALEPKVQTINLNVQGETELVVRRISSLDEIGESGGASRSEIPANEEWIDEWQNIWVEVWVSVLSSTAENGLRTCSADISYDPTIFSPFKNSKTQTFTVKYDSGIFSSVTVTKVEGENKLHIQATVKAEIEKAGACDLDGVGKHLLLGSIQFYGQKNGVSGTYEIQSSTIRMQIAENSVTMEDSLETTIGSIENTTENLPPVYPVVYDLNDSGSVDINDLVAFAKVYGQPSSQSKIAGLADFNANSRVEINDLVLFAKNYGKVVGTSVTYDSNLTKNWGNQPVQALAEEAVSFQTSFGNVYVNDWTAQAPDFEAQIEKENALRAELLDEILPQAMAQETIVSQSDARSELETVWEELRKDEVDELDVTLDEMIF